MPHLFLLLAAALAMVLPSAVSAQSGFGTARLSSAIDAQIEEFRQDEGIVGLTVAVTRNGRLIYSKGFGLARKAAGSAAAQSMRHDHRSRIGSVSKAVVSGPATWQALAERGLDSSARVYGSGGILGTRYTPHQRVSIDRFQPILAMAIGPDDRVYTWYENGTVSVGTSNDLDAHLPPRSFRVAEDKTPRDLVAVAIAPDSRVYAWYRDGTMSIGASRDLAYHHGRRTAHFPVGPDGDRKSIHDVLDITISKSDSRTYAFYDDGTVSGGTSLNLGEHFAWQRYTMPGEPGARFRIRGMGMSRDGSVYAWLSTGKALSGHRRDLGARRAPYDYSHPFEGQIPNRYLDITVQHLFDHRSGLAGSGDEEAARRAFPLLTQNGAATYDAIHRHVLATRPLLWDPGSRYSYSNHGMGLTTLLVEALTGKTYRDYAENEYLRPMDLKGRVRPQNATPDSRDSHAYRRTSDDDDRTTGHVPLPFQNSGTGLAAGGWTSSAQGVLAITAELADRYSHAEVDRMGFGGGGGKLLHTGSTGGGYAQVNVFSGNYVSASGRDLKGIHIAFAANTSDLPDGAAARISNLMDRIVIATADAAVPASVDYWPQAWE